MSVHVGLDLGGTNIKCAVVEIDGGELGPAAGAIGAALWRHEAPAGTR